MNLWPWRHDVRSCQWKIARLNDMVVQLKTENHELRARLNRLTGPIETPTRPPAKRIR